MSADTGRVQQHQGMGGQTFELVLYISPTESYLRRDAGIGAQLDVWDVWK